MRRESVGEHVGAVGVRPAVVLGAGLPLAVRLHQEAPEVGHQGVDLHGLGPPPGGHPGIERIGRRQAAEQAGGREVGREVDADAVGAKHRRNRRGLLQVGARQRPRVGIDVVEDGPVDPDRRVGAGVVAQARVDRAGQPGPVPERAAGIAPLDRAVEVVPVVEQTQRDARPLDEIERGNRLPGLQEPEEVEGAVQRAGLARRGNHNHPAPLGERRPDDEPLVARALEAVGPAEPRDEAGRAGGAHQDRAVLLDPARHANGRAEHPLEAAAQLVADDAAGRRIEREGDRRRRAAVRRAQRGVADRDVAKPEVVAGLRARGGGRRGGSRQREQEHDADGPLHHVRDHY